MPFSKSDLFSRQHNSDWKILHTHDARFICSPDTIIFLSFSEHILFYNAYNSDTKIMNSYPNFNILMATMLSHLRIKGVCMSHDMPFQGHLQQTSEGYNKHNKHSVKKLVKKTMYCLIHMKISVSYARQENFVVAKV